MITLEGWPDRHATLRALLRRKTDMDTLISVALDNHALVHFAACSDAAAPTICDDIWEGLPEEGFSALPIRENMTIAWCFWHLYRIEDLVSNIAISNGKQIFDRSWAERINAGITDTGNALSYAETVEMSRRIRKDELKQYCIAVGRNTREIISRFTKETLSRHPDPAAMDRIVAEGGLTENKHSIWLKRFWSNLTAGGLLLTPLTDHHCMHLPECRETKRLYLETAAARG